MGNNYLVSIRQCCIRLIIKKQQILNENYKKKAGIAAQKRFRQYHYNNQQSPCSNVKINDSNRNKQQIQITAPNQINEKKVTQKIKNISENKQLTQMNRNQIIVYQQINNQKIKKNDQLPIINNFQKVREAAIKRFQECKENQQILLPFNQKNKQQKQIHEIKLYQKQQIGLELDQLYQQNHNPLNYLKQEQQIKEQVIKNHEINKQQINKQQNNNSANHDNIIDEIKNREWVANNLKKFTKLQNKTLKLTNILLTMSKVSMKKIHFGITCMSCLVENIQYVRYKCLFCRYINLCSKCHFQQFEINQHKKFHPFLVCKQPLTLQQEKDFNLMVFDGTDQNKMLMQSKYNNIQHKHKCSGCDKGIFGLKFKCDTCSQMYLCQTCFTNQQYGKFKISHEKNHPILAYLFNQHIKINEDIQKIKILGQGGFGRVYKVRKISTGEIFALKVTDLKFFNEDRDNSNMKSFEQETAAYEELIDAHIISCYAVSVDKVLNAIGQQNLELKILLEYMPKGNLSNVLKNQKLSNYQKLVIIIDILQGLRRMHKKQFIHRDLKPQNILIDIDNRAKLADLGISVKKDDTSISGTPFWLPIQVFSIINLVNKIYPQSGLNKRQNKQKAQELLKKLARIVNTREADVFTLGMILNYIFTEELHQRLASGHIVYKIQSKYFIDEIKKCSIIDAQKRITVAQLYKSFNQLKNNMDQFCAAYHLDIKNLTSIRQDEILDNLYQQFIKK